MPEKDATQQQDQEDSMPEQVSPDESPLSLEEERVQLDPERLRYLRSIALGPATVRYKGPLVVSSEQIQRDIAASGIRDPQIRW